MKEKIMPYEPILKKPLKYQKKIRRKSLIKFWVNSLFYGIFSIIFILYSLLNIMIQSPNKTLPLKPAIVISGSMEPTIKTGSFIIVKRENNYQMGDIINFSNGKDDYTHRIVAVPLDEKVGKYYSTKGDANNADDDWIIKNENVNGEVIFKSYKIGKVILTIRQLPAVYYVATTIFLILILNIIATLVKRKSQFEELEEEEIHRENKKKMRLFFKHVKRSVRKKKIIETKKEFDIVDTY